MTRKDHSLWTIPFKNRSGTISFRLTGMNLGIRVQKNFSTTEAAEAFRDDLLKRATQGKTWRTVDTRLSESWLKQAEAVFEKFGKAEDGTVAPPFLQTAAEIHVATRRPTITPKPAMEVIDGFIEVRARRGNQKDTQAICRSTLRLGGTVTVRIGPGAPFSDIM